MTVTGRLVLRTAVLVAAGFAAFEATVRLDDWSQFDMPLLSSTNSMADLLIRDADGPHARAGAHFRQYRINSLGYRGPELSEADLARSRVLVTAGASETFGLYESPGREWPRQLADSLQASCGPTPIVVLNSAFAGMSLPTVEADLARRVRRVRPAYVLYYPTPMQYIEGEIPVAAQPETTPPLPAPRWRSRALPRVRDAVKRATPQRVLDVLRRVRSASARPAFDTVPTARLDRYEQDLRHMVATIRSIGAEPILAVHQNRFAETSSSSAQIWLRAWEKFYPLATGPVLVRFDSLAAIRTRQVASDSGAVLIDATARIRRARPDDVFADFSHFTTAGATIMASTASEALRQSPMCTAPVGTPAK